MPLMEPLFQQVAELRGVLPEQVEEIVTGWWDNCGVPPGRALLMSNLLSEDEARTIIKEREATKTAVTVTDDASMVTSERVFAFDGAALDPDTIEWARTISLSRLRSAKAIPLSFNAEERSVEIVLAIGTALQYEMEGFFLRQLSTLLGTDATDFSVSYVETPETRLLPFFTKLEREESGVTSEGDVSDEDERLANGRWLRIVDETGDALQRQVGQLISTLLVNGVHKEASDIHLDVTEDTLGVQTPCIGLRINGVLQDAFPGEYFTGRVVRGMQARFATAAEFRNATGRPEGAQLSVTAKEVGGLDLRLQKAPHGYRGNDHRLVIRILRKEQEVMSGALDSLYPPEFSSIAELTRKAWLGESDGLLLLAGRTGDGKSTTQAALLQELVPEGAAAYSIEDPVEYQLDNVSQFQTTRSFTFKEAIVTFLRLDPDVIAVGEIRDEETAQAVIQAVRTGHQVVSTIHAATASAAIPRLRALGASVDDIIDTLRGVLSQRLVKVLCTYCSRNEGEPVGCSAVGCNNGWGGRQAVGEVLLIDAEMRKAVKRGETADYIETHSNLAEDGTMKKHAKTLVEKGITTSEEISRVFGKSILD